MSPKDPLPILRPIRNFSPTRNSICTVFLSVCSKNLKLLEAENFQFLFEVLGLKLFTILF